MSTAETCLASDRAEAEWSLCACVVIDRLPAVFACIPHDWFEDHETRTIWQMAVDGHVGVDVLEQAKAALGYRSLRTLCTAISSTFTWNARWHAHVVWRNYRRRDTLLRYPKWLRALEAGEYPEAPVLWPAWEAEAIDQAPAAVAMAALLAERRAHERWIDTHIWWLLSARIGERLGP